MVVNSFSQKDGYDINNTNNNQDTNKSNETNNFMNEMDKTNKEKNQNTSSNEDEKTQKTEEKKEADLWAMFEDIKSLMKRGVTLEELKMMEDLMKEIFKKLNKEPFGQDDIKDINKLLKRLEDMILELKKRITGLAVKDGEESSKAGVSKDSLSFNTLSGETLKIENIGSKVGSSLIDRINDAIKSIKEIKDSKEKLESLSKNPSSKDELELLNQLKNLMK